MIMAPEIVIICTAFIILLVDLFLKNKNFIFPLAILGLLVAFCFGLDIYATNLDGHENLLGGQFNIDSSIMGFKFIFIMTCFVSVLIADYQSEKIVIHNLSEFYILLLFSLVGMMFLVSSSDLITAFVALELSTFPLFLLSAWQKYKEASVEAALKFVLLGAFSSALLLFGISLLYGLTGSMEIAPVTGDLPRLALYLSIALIFAGIGFKMTIFPFHQWAPDVYENAPTSITAFLSIASKAAGVAFFLKIFFEILGPLHSGLQFIYIIAAVITMSFGNLVAIIQKDIKRFMAYSSISHAGFIFMGLLSHSSEAMASIIFFFMAYLVSNLTIFAVISFMQVQTGRTKIKDYAGFAAHKPMYAFSMLIALFSLAGIPPLAGFLGKFALMNIAAKEGFYWLVGVAAINSTVSLYYYLQIIRQMYVEKADSSFDEDTPLFFNMILLFLSVATVLLGICPILF